MAEQFAEWVLTCSGCHVSPQLVMVTEHLKLECPICGHSANMEVAIKAAREKRIKDHVGRLSGRSREPRHFSPEGNVRAIPAEPNHPAFVFIER